MVCARALPLTGGVETHVGEVSSRLAAAGVDVSVLTTDAAGALAAGEHHSGYRTYRWPAYPRGSDAYFSPGLGRHLSRSRGRYDIVHLQGVHSLVAPAALAAARLADLPVVVTFHTGGHSSAIRSRLRPAQWRALAPLLRHSRELIAVCEYERAEFASILGVPETRIRLIPNGHAPPPVSSAAAEITGDPLLVSLGRLERYKGHHRILAAMPAILAAAPGAVLAIIGFGGYEPALRQRADRLGVGDRVVIRGYGPQERDRLGRLLTDANLVCLLSEYEAHPVAVTEALGCGTRVLVAETSGLAELARHELVTTVPLHSPPRSIAATVAATVAALAAMPATGSPLLPSWDDCAGALRQLYRDVAG